MSTHGKLSDPEYQRRVNSYRRNREINREDHVRQLMDTESGRDFAYWIVYELGRLERPSFNANIKDGACAAMHQAHAEGRRELAMEVLGLLQDMTPRQVLLMRDEQEAQRQAELAVEGD
jgi:hypothetical protein